VRAKQTREYREDTGEVTVPGAEATPKKADGSLYADQAAPAMVSDGCWCEWAFVWGANDG
jgi:hypothetical protein